jgi:two-component system LytT family sensor kinase
VVEAYLDIERARFEDRLQVRIDVPARLRSAQVPPLLLQPLVENAVKHGIAPTRFGGQVTVVVALDQRANQADELRVSIIDTGVGCTDAMLSSGRERGVGLRNVQRRLECHYGQQASMTVRTAPGEGMAVVIRFPVSLPARVDAGTARVGG